MSTWPSLQDPDDEFPRMGPTSINWYVQVPILRGHPADTVLGEGPELPLLFDYTIVPGNNPPLANAETHTWLVGGEDNGPHSMYTDFYFRIWVVERFISVPAARAGTDYGFFLWNAFPWDNELNSITIVGDGASEVMVDQVPVESFQLVEYRRANVSITADAPRRIQVEITFEFTLGEGTLFFNAVTATVLNSLPDLPVNESWIWKTDVITKSSGKTQRISLRNVPRLTIDYQIMPTTAEESRRIMHSMGVTMGSTVVVPYYQYSARVTTPASLGATVIQVDTVISDLREEENMFFSTPEGDFQIVEIAAAGLTDTQVTLETGVEFDVDERTLCGPAYNCFLQDGTVLQRPNVDELARISVDCRIIDFREFFTRPGSTALAGIPLFDDGLMILDKRPTANKPLPDSVFSDFQITDNEVGRFEQKQLWDEPEFRFEKTYLVPRWPSPDFDYWRDFLDAIKGKRVPFYTSTFRKDLVLVNPPAPSTSEINVFGDQYSTFYFQHESFKQLAFDTEAGMVYRNVISAAVDLSGNDVINFSPGLPAGPEAANVFKVHLLVRTRLLSDTVRVRHEATDSFITFKTTTADAVT